MTPTPSDRASLPLPRLVIDYYTEPRPGGRAQLFVDVVVDGELIPELSGSVGSVAPVDSVRPHVRTLRADAGEARLRRVA
jgi:hypothetical protein